LKKRLVCRETVAKAPMLTGPGTRESAKPPQNQVKPSLFHRMPNKRSRIYTKRGDDGTTSLDGKRRFPKGNLRIEAIGTIDELNSLLGILIAQEISSLLKPVLLRVQNQLFDLGAELAIPQSPRMNANMVSNLEQDLDTIDNGLPSLKGFVLPGGTLPAAHLHLARCVCRRAERRLCQLASQPEGAVNEQAICYLNRLSDLLFVMARSENAARGCGDTLWSGDRPSEPSD
jgi:cob(I)alamin adenosyltransferase